MSASEVLTVRPARDTDSEAVCALVQAVSGEFGLRWDPDGYDADLKAVASHYADAGGWFELLERDCKLVGTIGLYPHSSSNVELRKMYFLPGVRGRGLGKALLARNLVRARDAGYAVVTLETATVLDAAIGLYRRFGFTRQQGAPVGGALGCDQVWRLELAGYRAPPAYLSALKEVDLNDG